MKDFCFKICFRKAFLLSEKVKVNESQKLKDLYATVSNSKRYNERKSISNKNAAVSKTNTRKSDEDVNVKSVCACFPRY